MFDAAYGIALEFVEGYWNAPVRSDLADCREVATVILGNCRNSPKEEARKRKGNGYNVRQHKHYYFKERRVSPGVCCEPHQ